jgi:hypothetical protein
MGSPWGTEHTHSGLRYRYSSAPAPYAMTYDSGRRSRRGWGLVGERRDAVPSLASVGAFTLRRTVTRRAIVCQIARCSSQPAAAAAATIQRHHAAALLPPARRAGEWPRVCGGDRGAPGRGTGGGPRCGGGPNGWPSYKVTRPCGLVTKQSHAGVNAAAPSHTISSSRLASCCGSRTGAAWPVANSR